MACRQAAVAIKGIRTHPIDKTGNPKHFTPERWRHALALAAVQALENQVAKPYQPPGPFRASLTLRDGAGSARKLARRWKLRFSGTELHLNAHDIHDLYRQLINVSYLTPAALRIIPVTLWLSNLYGRLGLWWVRRYLAREGLAG